MKTPSDFQYLAQVITTRCRTVIGVSTLKRIWGYDRSEHVPRYSTMSLLAQLVGYKDWESFLKDSEGDKLSSATYMQQVIYVSELVPGERIEIAWPPNRICQFLYLGDSHFRVELALNSKLRAGDHFTCFYFALGLPLFLENFVHGKSTPTTFIVGYVDGLSMVRKIKSQE
ncbi:MAG: hypothetical protein J5642_03120 [Bacteroidales bacterium]|nr:hypothetical protein [Bacteroidales bacterium]